ncbi:sulfurtransferase [Marinomonas sp. THO17]
MDSRFYLTDLAKGHQEYLAGHIPGAIFIDLHHELAGEETQTSGRHPLPSVDDFAQCIQQWGVGLDSDVIVYDDMGGAMAARAWWMLTQQGIKTRVLNGGYPAWKREGRDIDTLVPDVTPNTVSLKVEFPWSVSEQQVVENFETNQFQLVDSRAQDRFLGENETMDPVAGHIPGAINRPFMDNLDEKGRFKPAEQLHVEWQDWIMHPVDDYVYYCGSGVTACHNILALNYAGIDARLLYVGSWSQWSKRMSRLMQGN